MQFIKATENYNTFDAPVPAPYIRKNFYCDSDTTAKLTVACCGFYELYINGEKKTKGFIAPYISNPNHYVYYDEYVVCLSKGENVLGFILGNGFQNNPGGYIWNFDKADFRSAPLLAVSLNYKDSQGKDVLIESGADFKTFPSPILSDDYRFGETYDARQEIADWNKKSFDDREWQNAIPVPAPNGELRLCSAQPICSHGELKPVSIIPVSDGYIYDFGQVNAGICKLKINGKEGQRIELHHADVMKDGDIFLENIWFVRDLWERDKNIVHCDTYICKGGDEEYTPSFTYHGFRYVKVTGIEPSQANEELLTYILLHSDIKQRAHFSCSDNTINKLYEILLRSDVSNFHYFPTDCPHREKNGWTADAALSCERMLMFFDVEKSLAEWQRNICKAQNAKGALPGIVPTADWGFAWGNGPAWDCVLAYLPYYVYIYRGETEMISESADAFIKYLKYLLSRVDSKGLLHIGLGDWCHVGRNEPKAPLALTDTVMSMDIANKIAFMLDKIGLTEESTFARETAEKFRKAIRDNLIDFNTFTALGECQSSQAMCIYYGVFEECELQSAFSRLIELINEQDCRMDVGVLGARVIFHLLSEFGESELAYRMITRPEFPSYVDWLNRGATTLWEMFSTELSGSTNHHFWGDIGAWFVKSLAGIRVNPDGESIYGVHIKPCFISQLDSAEAYCTAPYGKIASSWKRMNGCIILTLEIPKEANAEIILENGYTFEDGTTRKQAFSGDYKITAI